MKHYRFTVDGYAVLLKLCNLEPNNIAEAYVSVYDPAMARGLDSVEENGLLKEVGGLTEEGVILASAICQPQKCIAAVNNTFGGVPYCYFCLKEHLWYLIEFDNEAKCVNIIAPIEKSEIEYIAREALVGNLIVDNYSPFSITLNNDEMAIFNLSLLLMGTKSKINGGSIPPQEGSFSVEDLLLGREFATLAMTEDISSSSELFNLLDNPYKFQAAIDKLISKKVLARANQPGRYKPDIVYYYKLAPSKNMVMLSYCNVETGLGHKYYIFTDSIMAITADKNSVTFSQARDINLSLFSEI